MESLKFGVELEDKVSGSSEKASGSLKHLQHELVESKEKLAAYQQQLSSAKALGDIEGFRTYSELVAKTRRETFELSDSILKAGGSLRGLGGEMKKVIEPAEVMHHALEHTAEGLKEFGSALKSGEVGEAIAGLAGAAAGLAGTLDLLVPGLGSVASGAIRMGGAIAGAFAGLIEEGVKTAFEVREVNDHFESLFQALGKGPEAGKRTLDMLNKISTELPQSRDQLGAWTAQLERLGHTDLGDLQQQLRAIASAQALNAEGGAEAYTKLIEKVGNSIDQHKRIKIDDKLEKQLHAAGLTLGDLDGKLGKVQKTAKGLTVDAETLGHALRETITEKGEGPLEKMGEELGSIKNKAAETFHHFFDEVDISPIVAAFKSVIHLGDAGTSTGDALKTGITGGINAVAKGIAELITDAEVGFIHLETYIVETGVTMKDVKSAVHEVVVDVETLVTMFGQAAAAAGYLKDHLGNLHDTRAPLEFAREKLEARDAAGGATPRTAPAHADGGIVERPPPGEFFTSVAPGERIVPAGNDNGGGGVHIGTLHLTVVAPTGGVTDAQSVSASGLALALERYQLASGR